MKCIDMVNKKYGHLKVIKMLPNYNNKKKMYCLCDCDCGNKGIIREAWSLRNKSTELTSCGCANKEKVKIYCGKNIDGKKFGKLKVVKTLWESTPPQVECQCDCGKRIILSKNDVQSGHTKSCGCLNKEVISNYFTKDWTNYISASGVKMIKPLYQNKSKQWMWECVCPLCNNLFVALPIKITNNHTTSCGCKKQSSGERIIGNILKEFGLEYQEQYSFDNCRYKYKLKYDFAIFNDNKLSFLIEYDGIQHFKPISIFGGEDAFKETKIRDEIKTKYCRTNKITLLRFNYLQSVDEITNIISKYIESVTTAGGTW